MAGGGVWGFQNHRGSSGSPPPRLNLFYKFLFFEAGRAPSLKSSDEARLKIPNIKSIVLRFPKVQPIGDGCQSILLIRVHTDEGITGIGEAHTNPTISKAIIEAPMCSLASWGLRDLLIGEN